ncbi:MAG: rRNA pseudouridine synthase [Deltaproteobacteria bacterium]|nr:rRNA pseudouridine synthase [Deltaproteobacteria bacterium]
MSLAGITSRRKADDLILTGRVQHNEQVVHELGTRARWGIDSIKVDGKEIPKPSDRIYLMLNKPFGYLCAMDDSTDRPLVTELLTNVPQRVYSVGRLDFDTLGLLLFTNNGDLAHRLTHPKYRISRTYKVTVQGTITEPIIQALCSGVHLEDGFSGPAKVNLLKHIQGKTLLRMTIVHGKNRLVRRMLEAVGYKVVHLVRTGFGSLELGDLKIGQYRFLEASEVTALKQMVGLK